MGKKESNFNTHNICPFIVFCDSCFNPSGPFSVHRGAMSGAKLDVELYIKLQLKIRDIEIHKIHCVLGLILYASWTYKTVYIRLKVYCAHKSYSILVSLGHVIDIFHEICTV
jgi:hypothetical protein